MYGRSRLRPYIIINLILGPVLIVIQSYLFKRDSS